MAIVRTENICFGRPRLDGTRLEVYNIISDLQEPINIDEYCSEMQLKKKDVKEAIQYCKTLQCQEIKLSYEKYCSGCILSTLHEEYNYKYIDLQKIKDQIFFDSNNTDLIAFGEKGEIEDELSGKPGWIMASNLAP